MAIDFSRISGFLFDLDGTLTVDGKILPGAAEALIELNRRSLPFRICTNTTTFSRASMSRILIDAGIPVTPDQVVSAPIAAREYLRQNRCASCWLLLAEDTLNDFSEFRQNEVDPEVIVIGDIGERWDYKLMSRLFRMLRDGTELLVLHKGKYWLTLGEEKLDIGAFIVGLEYASGCTANVIGKPSGEFYQMAVRSLELPAESVVMIGDDPDNDIAGAQAAGLQAILVRTGKALLAHSAATPDLVLESVAELPQLLV